MVVHLPGKASHGECKGLVIRIHVGVILEVVNQKFFEVGIIADGAEVKREFTRERYIGMQFEQISPFPAVEVCLQLAGHIHRERRAQRGTVRLSHHYITVYEEHRQQ